MIFIEGVKLYIGGLELRVDLMPLELYDFDVILGMVWLSKHKAQEKIEHQKPAGELQSLSILEWKWEDISMDFVMGLTRGKKGNDAIWVVVDRLTKSALFLPMKMTDSVDKLAKIVCK